MLSIHILCIGVLCVIYFHHFLYAVFAGGTDQEVEIQMYDADNLSSPPSSKGSDTDLTSYDPLLDFSRDDGFDHQPGVKSAGAEMNSSVQKMQREISVSTYV